MNIIASILLQAGGAGGTMNLILLSAMFIVMYFFLLRPQMKKQKQEKSFAQTIQQGDKIVTKGGIHGKITRMDEGSSISLQIDKNTQILLERSFISMDMTKTAYPKAEINEVEKK